MSDQEFYLGRAFDIKANRLANENLGYRPGYLTTHGVVVGMTGSGKTGLCIGLLEEAALQEIPAIIVDPKGDLTNLLLHFPELRAEDFKPWIDPEVADRAGQTLDDAASRASSAWQQGLQQWGVKREQLAALNEKVKFAIYTPGSSVGIPLNVASTLTASTGNGQLDPEALADKVSSTVTALLTLIGFENIEPLQSREHILISKLYTSAWSQGKDLDLTKLIMQIQNPPFPRLGALSVDAFFPPKDRMELSIQLNNILAAPTFEKWLVGQPLDIPSLLYTPDGKPRHSIFYLGHLNDADRMFFVTLLLASLEAWMRVQKGSGLLRALFYMDEIYGYLPPVANPPSKAPLLRMFKQARAFGLGLLVATQNPVDLDYKAISNAGTWFVGKLQTDQDKQRLLDGLMGAAGTTSRADLDSLISQLGKRVFLLHSVNAPQPVVFQTRWTMNFLAGPLTLPQIPDANKLVAPVAQPAPSDTQPVRPQSAPAVPNAPAPAAGASTDRGSQTKPPIPPDIGEYFVPQTHSLPEAFAAAGQSMPAEAVIRNTIYRPALLFSAKIHFLDRRVGVDTTITRAGILKEPPRGGSVRWEDSAASSDWLDKLDTGPTPGTLFGAMVSPLDDAKRMTALHKDFTDWAYRTTAVKARVNQALKVFAGPDVSQADFMKACADAARDARDAELSKATAMIDRKIKALEDRLAREERELQQDQTQLNQRKTEEIGNALEMGASLFGLGRKKSISTQLSKRRMTEQAKGNVEESVQAIAQYKKDLADLTQQREQLTQEVSDRWGQAVNDISEVNVTPKKTDIYVDKFGVAWLPYYFVQYDGQTLELPAFGE